MNTDEQTPAVWPLTITSLVILLVLYPMSIAPIGKFSNGGALGISFLLVAATLAWVAFVRSRLHPPHRWLVHLLVAAVVTLTAAWDCFAQYRSGWWLGI